MGIKLSYTASDRYSLSPRSYYFHYIRRLRPKIVGSALVFGGAVDDGLNILIETGGNIEKARTAFDQAFDMVTINGALVDLKTSDLIRYSKADRALDIWTPEDVSLSENATDGWISLRRKAYLMFDAYKEQILPRIQDVIYVQKMIKLENDEKDTFTGVVDLFCVWEDGRRIVFDNKTAGVAYKPESARESRQLATYFEALQDDNPDAVGYIVIPKNFRKKKLPLIDISVIIDNVPDELIDLTFDEYSKNAGLIKMGVFPCTEKCKQTPWGCEFAKLCETGSEEGLIEVKEEVRRG